MRHTILPTGGRQSLQRAEQSRQLGRELGFIRNTISRGVVCESARGNHAAALSLSAIRMARWMHSSELM